MPQFTDNLYLGGSQGGPNDTFDFPSGYGVGPLGRMFLWNLVPLALGAANIAASQTPAGAGLIVLTAGAGVTQVVNSRGETVLQLDCPRAVSIFLTGAGTPRAYVVTGYDYAGQKMTETITTVAAATTSGKKAFNQILSISGAGGSAQPITVGTTDVLGAPVCIPDKGFIIAVHWANAQPVDAGTTVVADTTNPATTSTGDVRGTYLPSSATDGVKRLVMAIGMPGNAAGPQGTRANAYGVNQDLFGT